MSEQEKKDKKFSIIVSAIIHSSLIAIFLVLVAWREPDPPVPEYGIELNLGFQEAGSGDIERTIDAPLEDTENDTPPDAETDTENNETEESQEEIVEEQPVEEAKIETPPVEEVKEVAPPVEETVSETITSPEKTEVKVEEKTPPVTETKKEEIAPPVEEKKEEVKPKEEPKPKPVVDNRALMGGKKTDTDNKEAASNNQGTQTDIRGNMGDPTGKTNTTGTDPGGADLGVSYSLDGWKWKSPPADKDDSQIDGVIKFSITVDDRGKVLNATIIPGTTISDNTIVEFYKKQVLQLSFIQTDPSKTAASISKGEVTFVIKTN